jgi:hypothetical protein
MKWFVWSLCFTIRNIGPITIIPLESFPYVLFNSTLIRQRFPIFPLHGMLKTLVWIRPTMKAFVKRQANYCSQFLSLTSKSLKVAESF